MTNFLPVMPARSSTVPVFANSALTRKCSTLDHSIATERRFGCGPSAWIAPEPSSAYLPNRPCRIANWTCFSRISFTFSPEPAELIALMSILLEACSFTFTSVAIATPTG
jgi:hypothetical protein